MKFLNITQSLEQHFANVLDAALKGFGLQIAESVHLIRSAIQEKEDPPVKPA
jgi:hypothetical protein